MNFLNYYIENSEITQIISFYFCDKIIIKNVNFINEKFIIFVFYSPSILEACATLHRIIFAINLGIPQISMS